MKNSMAKKDVYKEVFVVLSYFNETVIKKIPSTVFNEIIDFAADSNLEVEIDVTKKLKDQNISEESKSIISLIYYKYIVDDEKQEVINIWRENDK